MRDWARLRQGVLLPYYAARHVTDEEAAGGPFTRDASLSDFLRAHGLGTGAADEPMSASRARELAAWGRAQIRLENEAEGLRRRLEAERLEHGRRETDLDRQVSQLQDEVAAFSARRVVRLTDSLATKLRRG
jgi:hypothetical protein